ncbi:hypothetical protein NDU88_000138 [Pleurodeles waltl]|uniref:Uncharacterized protein n=1 Tax=Pleurodeles waltl TaxID=8319 RepID=A0AAV7N8L8_PLEWA|nr:hypothetical protein NDU88_000138 [Pleurodeles waltl]
MPSSLRRCRGYHDSTSVSRAAAPRVTRLFLSDSFFPAHFESPRLNPRVPAVGRERCITEVTAEDEGVTENWKGPWDRRDQKPEVVTEATASREVAGSISDEARSRNGPRGHCG